MKKTLSVFLAIVLVLSLAPSVLAGSFMNAFKSDVKADTVVFEKYDLQDGQTALEEGTYIITGIDKAVSAMTGTFLYGKFVNLFYNVVSVVDDRIIYESEAELNYEVMWDVESCDDNSFYLKHCTDDSYLTPGAAGMSLDQNPGNAWTLKGNLLSNTEGTMVLSFGYGNFTYGAKKVNTELNFYKLNEEADVPIETEDPSVEHDEFVETNYFTSGTYLFVGDGGGYSHAMNNKKVTESERPGLAATTVNVNKEGKIIDPPEATRWNVDYVEEDGAIITNLETGEMLYLDPESDEPLTLTNDRFCSWDWGVDDRSEMTSSYKNVLKLFDPGEDPNNSKTVVTYRYYNGTFASDIAVSGSDNIRLYKLDDGTDGPVATETPDLKLPSSVPAGERFVAMPVTGSTVLEPGYYVFATEGNKAMTYTPNNRGFLKGFAAVDIEPVEENGKMVLKNPDSTLVWEVSLMSSSAPYYYFRCLVNGQYLAGSGNSYTTGLHLEKDTSAEFTLWQLSQKYESVEWSFAAQGIRNNYSTIAYNSQYEQFELNDRVNDKMVLYKLEGDLLYDGEEPVYPDDPATTAPVTTNPVTTAPATTAPVVTDSPDVTGTPDVTDSPDVTNTPDVDVTGTPDLTTDPALDTYTVTFVDWDGKVLAEVEVAEGEAAEAPAEEPTRENWVFAGWDADFTEVTEDMTVKAVYYKLGDVNLNGEPDAGDGTLVLREVVGSSDAPLSELQLKVADVNGTGTIDAGDATMILRHAVGTETIDYGPDAPAEEPEDETTEGPEEGEENVENGEE